MDTLNAFWQIFSKCVKLVPYSTHFKKNSKCVDFVPNLTHLEKYFQSALPHCIHYSSQQSYSSTSKSILLASDKFVGFFVMKYRIYSKVKTNPRFQVKIKIWFCFRQLNAIKRMVTPFLNVDERNIMKMC